MPAWLTMAKSFKLDRVDIKQNASLFFFIFLHFTHELLTDIVFVLSVVIVLRPYATKRGQHRMWSIVILTLY